MIGTILLAIYVIGAVALALASLLLPALRLEFIYASVAWGAGGGIYLLIRRLRSEREELATLTRIYLQQLEQTLESQNAGLPAEKLLKEFVTFCSSQLGVEKAALFTRRRVGFVAGETQGIERKALAGIKIRSKDDLIATIEQDRHLHDVEKYFRGSKRKNPFAEFGLTHMLPIFSGKSLSHFMIFSLPPNRRLRLLRPFLLALSDQLGVYRRQEESRSRSSQLADKAKKQLASAKAELEEEQSGQELLSAVVLDAQNRLAGVQTRDHLYEAAFGLLKKRFKAGSLLILGSKEDSDKFTALFKQGINSKLEEDFSLQIGAEQLKQLENERNGIHFGNKRGKESGSEAAKTLKRLGIFSLYFLHRSRQETVLLGVGGGGGALGNEESAAAGALVRLIGLVLANLAHLEKIEEMSYTDSMTGLYNYRYFYKRLKEEILRAQRFSRTLGLVIFDIDGFKVFNDTYGHQAGDQLLRQLGKLLTSSVRTVDVVSRYGGEEFCIIMPESGPDDCRTFMERLRNKILENRFHSKFSNEKHRITVSLGGAIYPNDAQRVDRLIYCADMALLEAKDSGRNKSCMYEKNLTEDKQPS